MTNDKYIEISEFEEDYIVKEIGKGTTATCYLTKDGQIFKKFNGLMDYSKLNIESFIHYSCPNITFPKKLVTSNNELIGYIKDYATGAEIDKLDDSINMKKFIESLRKLYYVFYENHFYEIFKFIDLSDENIVYDSVQNKFTIIDVDFFEFTSGYENVKEDVVWINLAFYCLVKNCYDISPTIDKMLRNQINGITSMPQVLETIIGELQSITGDEIITLGDYKQAIQKAKRTQDGEPLILKK